mgnify:CR=1 FL=1
MPSEIELFGRLAAEIEKEKNVNIQKIENLQKQSDYQNIQISNLKAEKFKQI